MLITYMISYEFSKYYSNIMNYLYTFTIMRCYTEYNLSFYVRSENFSGQLYFQLSIYAFIRRIYDDQRNAESPGCQVPVRGGA